MREFDPHTTHGTAFTAQHADPRSRSLKQKQCDLELVQGGIEGNGNVLLVDRVSSAVVFDQEKAEVCDHGEA